MTNTHYLLLTDEERVLYERLAEGLPESARMFAAALMAARAENKSLRHEAKIALDFLHDWEASDFQSADEGVQSSFYMTVGGLRHALLQSEKERCPVHGFEFPCLGCAELALHVGVDALEESK